MMNTRIDGTLLDSEQLYPYYKAACDFDVPIVVHPASDQERCEPNQKDKSDGSGEKKSPRR